MVPELQKKVAKYNAYQNHPLRDEYLKEKKSVVAYISDNNKTVNKTGKITFFLFIMVFVYFIIFCNVLEYDPYNLIVIILGILNIIALFLSIAVSESDIKSSKEYKDLIEKYKQLGLEEFTSADVEKGGCIYDGCCGVTGRSLSYEESQICNKAHCEKCKTFMKAVYGFDDYELRDTEILHD